MVDDGHCVRELARMRHREVDLTCTDLLGPARDAAAQADGRLRPAGDLDVTPRERACDAEAQGFADGLLAREPAGIALRRVGPRVAVGAFRLREAPLAKAWVAVERPPDTLDLYEVDSDFQWRATYPCSSSQSGSCAIEEMMPPGRIAVASTASGRNFPVRTRIVRMPCA